MEALIPENDTRGQMMIITALAIAFLFVTLAIVTNSVIFVENLSARGENIGKTNPITYNHEVQELVFENIQYVNHHPKDDYSEQISRLKNMSGEINKALRESYSSNSKITDFTISSTTKGTIMYQNKNGNFTSNNGDTKWKLYSLDRHSRSLQMTISDSNLVSLNNPNQSELANSSAFRTNIDTGSETWTTYFYEDSGEIIVVTEKPSDTLTKRCSTTKSSVDVDYSDIRVGMEHCHALEYYPQLGTHQIQFEHSDNVYGTFSVVIEEALSNVDAPVDVIGGGGKVTKAPAIYSAQVKTEFYSSRYTYHGTIKTPVIAP